MGGGQLGRMIAIEAMRMGYRVIIQDPDPDGPAAQVADECVVAAWDDADAMRKLAQRCDVLTIESEHISYKALAGAEEVRPVHPSANVMRMVQDRLTQREFLASHDVPQPSFASVSTPEELAAAMKTVGAPSILKTRAGGYDGKGQARLRSVEDAEEAWASLGQRPCVIEGFVTFEKEVSVLLARRADGSIARYPLAENVHRDGILHTTVAPANVSVAVAERAYAVATAIAERMDHVGVMAVEMFVLADGSVLVNEVAPRVHNSGHFTLGASATSQFEQHVRAICGLTLGDTSSRPAAMLNLLGDLWQDAEPDWAAALASHYAHLHLYGKRKARPGRKMAHITAVHDDAPAALAVLQAIDAKLRAEGEHR